jgi:hypothetical protein
MSNLRDRPPPTLPPRDDPPEPDLEPNLADIQASSEVMAIIGIALALWSVLLLLLLGSLLW